MSFVDTGNYNLANSNYKRFPLDLGTSSNQGHFMTITIFPSGKKSGNVQTVALFIPGGGQNGALQWQMAHEYDEVKLTRLGLNLIGAVSPTTQAGVELGLAGARIAGKGTINPKVDVLYANSDLREFQFDYFMSPQAQQEQRAMHDIIKLLRKYSAPEITANAPSGLVDTITGGLGALGADAQRAAAAQLKTGFWFIPPAEFEIKFRYIENGQQKENPYVPKIARSVLRRVDVNYTQQGEFSTFRDGAPTSAQLTLVFKEMRIIDQNDVENGY